MYQEVDYKAYAKEVMAQLQKGAFLTVKDKKETNTMTIGWGTLGFMWGRPVFVTVVRYSRYTFEMLKNTDQFTISLPLNKDLKKELIYCGTHSKRDGDKIKECQLTLVDGKKVETPIIDECDLHYECQIVCRQDMKGCQLSEEIDNKLYADDDYHIMFYGEIVASYIKKA